MLPLQVPITVFYFLGVLSIEAVVRLTEVADLDEQKPILLFEKLASYINNVLNSDLFP